MSQSSISSYQNIESSTSARVIKDATQAGNDTERLPRNQESLATKKSSYDVGSAKKHITHSSKNTLAKDDRQQQSDDAILISGASSSGLDKELCDMSKVDIIPLSFIDPKTIPNSFVEKTEAF